jgi:ankyrin repeat protein
MMLSEVEVQELQKKYSYLVNYESEDPDAPIDPLTYVDSNGDALLHIAAQNGDLRTVEMLLKAGVDVNQVGDMGNTALHYAKAEDVASLLLAHGASIEVRNEFGQRPEAGGKK